MRKGLLVLLILCSTSLCFAQQEDQTATGNEGYVVGEPATSEDTPRDPSEFVNPIKMLDDLVRKIFW